MGNKKDKKDARHLKKREKKLQKLSKTLCPPKGCKSKCCQKYKKGEQKRCKKCPCFDLLKQLQAQEGLQKVA